MNVSVKKRRIKGRMKRLRSELQFFFVITAVSAFEYILHVLKMEVGVVDAIAVFYYFFAFVLGIVVAVLVVVVAPAAAASAIVETPRPPNERVVAVTSTAG